jgi:PAS domain-containing protein/DNA-binding CsgD family transcriptional regulator
MNDYFPGCDAHRGFGVFIQRDDARFALLSLRRHKNRGVTLASEVTRLSLLLPHLQRAFQLRRRMSVLESEADAFGAPLDQLDIGVFILDSRGRVTRMNHAAEALVAAQDGLTVLNGRFDCAKLAARRLHGLIVGALALADGIGLQSGGILRIPRPSGKSPYQVLVSPLPNQRDRTFGAAGIVLVKDPESLLQVSEAVLMEAYALSDAEARLTAKLIECGSLARAADQCGLTAGSARQYMKRIFSKTCTQGQVELVTRIMGSLRV